jgi:hypothetical protein
LLSLSVTSPPLQPRLTTYDAVVSGKACNNGKVEAGQWDCDYHVGKSLRFTIAGVGTPDAGIVFNKSDIDGDYYAAFGTQHGCIIVWPGGTTNKANPQGVMDNAFVSPRNGNVYRDWRTCASSA